MVNSRLEAWKIDWMVEIHCTKIATYFHGRGPVFILPSVTSEIKFSWRYYHCLWFYCLLNGLPWQAVMMQKYDLTWYMHLWRKGNIREEMTCNDKMVENIQCKKCNTMMWVSWRSLCLQWRYNWKWYENENAKHNYIL